MPQPLVFHRRTKSSTRELFGSVTAADVVSTAREFGIGLEETQGNFDETEGIEKGRVKNLGHFSCEWECSIELILTAKICDFASDTDCEIIF